MKRITQEEFLDAVQQCTNLSETRDERWEYYLQFKFAVHDGKGKKVLRRDIKTHMTLCKSIGLIHWQGTNRKGFYVVSDPRDIIAKRLSNAK
jgi:hypothetical protein